MKNKIKRVMRMTCCGIKYFLLLIPGLLLANKNRKVWLISERGTDARDNGYHFYTYLKNNHPEIKVKYIITKNSPDKNKIKTEDTIWYGSIKHYLMFISAGKVISTHIMGYSPDMSLFWRLDKKGLLKICGKRIFLQHGILGIYTKQLDRGSSKLDLFIASAEKERNFIMAKSGYEKNVVKVTGLPRYDRLIDESVPNKKVILIMPTYRKWLNYTDDFTNSDYFRKWNELLNDKEFIDYIESNSIKVFFCPHYEIQKFIKSFGSKSKNIIVASHENFDVQTLLKKANIMITDYSSVHFDFAYQRKPIIYFQFDEKRFYTEHYEKGFIDYKKDGFGPVVSNQKDLVKNLKELNYEKYKKRADDFFDKIADGCSKKVFDEIVKLDRKTVLHVVSSLNRGGTENYMMGLIGATSDRVNNIVLSYSKVNDWQNETTENDIPVFTVQGKNTNLQRIKMIRRIIKTYNVDILYSYTYYNSAYVLITSLWTKAKNRIVHAHRSDVDRKVNLLKVLLCRIIILLLTTHKLACSKTAGQSLFIGKYTIIKNGIDLEKFSFNPEVRNHIRKQYGIKDKEILIGTVGRIDNNKNQVFLLPILSILNKSNNKYKLIVIGDGEEKEHLKNEALKNGQEKNIIFTGSISDTSGFYSAMDLLVMPSKKEGFPYVLIEAQANGLPVVASATIGTESRINENFEFASLDCDYSEWVSAINKVKRQMPNEAIVQYSIDAMSKQLEDIYES